VLPGYLLAPAASTTSLPTWRTSNRPRNTICTYRRDLTGFAAHHDGDIAGLSAVPVRAFPGEIAGQAPSTRKRKRAVGQEHVLLTHALCRRAQSGPRPARW